MHEEFDEETAIPDRPTTVPVVEDQRPRAISVTSLLEGCDGLLVDFKQAHEWNHIDMWDRILCPSVLVSRKELLELLAAQFQFSRNRAGMLRVARAKILLGCHVCVTTTSGMRLHYRSGGTYSRKGDNTNVTWIEVEGYDTIRRKRTSRLAHFVCGVQLQNVCEALGERETRPFREVVNGTRKDNDSVTFVLVRYAQAHPSATRRGPNHRPLTPGPLENSHCLWTWAKRPVDYVRGCFRPRPWERHRQYFGRTDADQRQARQDDSLAWYDLVQVTNIRNFANIQKDPCMNEDDDDFVFLQSLLWC